MGLRHRPNSTPSFMRDPGSGPGSPCQLYNSPQKGFLAAGGGDGVGEVEGASGGRRGKLRKAKARNPGRPREKSENVLGARGKPRRARARAPGSTSSLSPTLTRAFTPTPRR